MRLCRKCDVKGAGERCWLCGGETVYQGVPLNNPGPGLSVRDLLLISSGVTLDPSALPAPHAQ